MSDVTLFGFPRSTYVQIAALVLTQKEVPYAFHDLEGEMNTQSHLALHPFERVPILRHRDFTLYETSAIVAYVDDVFGTGRLTPEEPQMRARMNQWISAVNSYYYPHMIYHVSHERNVFPQLGIPSDEKVVAAAMPKVRVCLEVMERELRVGGSFCWGRSSRWQTFTCFP
jgi:glutathione S-transferase